MTPSLNRHLSKKPISDQSRFGGKTPQNYDDESSFWKPEVVDEWKPTPPTPPPKHGAEEWRPDEDESSDSEVEEILSKSPELEILDEAVGSFQLR